ncbi:MAG TPA: nucleotide excision repair endonuclease [Bdellovibrionota bacterium]|nr:nucleotide excision repair endonuclease [Bdellovibrionota bacterium]
MTSLRSLTEIPRVPGVYFLYDGRGRLLYIGKALRLRDRLRSYRRVNPATAPENVAALVPRIRQVKWQTFKTEREAFRREAELLRAIRPPFNIAGTWDADYLFIVMGAEAAGEKDVKLSLHLTDEPEADERERIFGCYRHRRKVKLGYIALLRLLYACRHVGRRFYSYPARISRESPPWQYSTVFPREWVGALSSFLDGRSMELLRLIIAQLLENDSVPRFLYPSLQDDLRIARAFYDLGPRGSRRLKLRHKLDVPVLSHAVMDDLTRREIDAGEFAGQVSWSG